MDGATRALLDKYENNLKEVLETTGEITDLDIIFCKPKGLIKFEEVTEDLFLKIFNSEKAKIRGTGGHRSLSDKTRKNFKKLIKRKFNAEDFTKAIKGMYSGESWAIKTANDTPTHLLREENFERYLNAYEHGTTKKEGRSADDKNADAKARILGEG